MTAMMKTLVPMIHANKASVITPLLIAMMVIFVPLTHVIRLKDVSMCLYQALVLTVPLILIMSWMKKNFGLNPRAPELSENLEDSDTNLTQKKLTAENSATPTLSVGAIVGISIAGVVVLAISVGIVVSIIRSKQQTSDAAYKAM